MAKRCKAPNCPRDALSDGIFCEWHQSRVTRQGRNILGVFVAVVMAVVAVARAVNKKS